MMSLPVAVYADASGTIYDAPGYDAVGRVGGRDEILKQEDMIPLPDGTDLMFLPGRSALVAEKGKIGTIASSLIAVAAAVPVGYTRTHLPAYTVGDSSPPLPLYGYTAVAMHKGKFWVAAIKTDDNAKWHPHRYNTSGLAAKVEAVKREMPQNRLVEHLARCSLEWHCCTAQNLFYHRWEAGIPVSPACNANCLGCISLQPAECCPAPQSRIGFVPSVGEVAEIGVYHLATAPEPIISFGQGCEGEPSLEAETIAPAIRAIRQETDRGVVNINTNGGYTVGIKKIVDAGLGSMRVSTISALAETHKAYYRADYTLDNVRESITYAKHHGVFVSLNMLLLPGLNDRPEEMEAWLAFIAETKVDMVQLRNLNIDPEQIWPILPEPKAPSVGVRKFVNKLQEYCPAVQVGNFSRYIGS